ncbi:MAG: hypothetical protein ACI9W2_000376 [Gammaproteobacteria bacterium]|jgi:hypothetical protein
MEPIRIAALALLGNEPQAHHEREHYLLRHPEITISRLCGFNAVLGEELRNGLELAGFPE